jgi:hypothetical protein
MTFPAGTPVVDTMIAALTAELAPDASGLFWLDDEFAPVELLDLRSTTEESLAAGR